MFSPELKPIEFPGLETLSITSTTLFIHLTIDVLMAINVKRDGNGFQIESRM